MINEILKQFEINNIKINENMAKKFNIYLNMLIEYNKNMNLTAITEPKRIIIEHFVDSCLPYKLFKKNSSVCDVGTGAGFPAIPLKIVRPDLNITMVDSLQKRLNFLNDVINVLKLENITSVHSRAQEFCLNSREKFDYTTARAVAPLNILSELCLPLTKVGGEFIAYKSKNVITEFQEAEKAIKLLGGELLGNKSNFLINKELKTQNSETKERNILIIHKMSTTPKEYPRLKNKIYKNPL